MPAIGNFIAFRFRSSVMVWLLFVYLLNTLAACTSSKKATEQGLADFKVLLIKDAPKHSFTDVPLSAAEIAALKPGMPIKIYAIGVHALRSYHPGEGKNALSDLHQYMVPVLNNDSIVTGMRVALVNGKWKVRSYGEAHLLRKFAAFAAGKFFANPPYLVRIPAFSLNFLGDYAGKQYNLTAMNKFTFDSIVPNVTISMDDVMRRLKPRADLVKTH